MVVIELDITSCRRTYSVDVHVIGVVVLGVFGLAGLINSKRYLAFLAILKTAVDVLGVNIVFGYLTTPDEATKYSRP